MPQLFTNNARSTLAGSITNVDTSMAVQALDAAKFPSPGAGDFFLATLVDGSGNREIVKCTARASATLTIVRGQEGTTPFAFASGASISVRLTAGTIANFLLGPGGAVADNAAVRMDGPSGNNSQAAPVIMEDNGDITPEVNDAGALGTDAKRWADLKLAIGAKINIGGDAEIAHSTDKLTLTVDELAIIGLLTIGALTVGGALTASGAFTSRGIDDNATGERLSIENSEIQVGDGTAQAEYAINRIANTQLLTLCGAADRSAGAAILIYGATNSSKPNHVRFTRSNVESGSIDSAGNWIINGTLTVTG